MIGRIIWAGSDRSGAHDDHLHVEPVETFSGRTDGTGDQPLTWFQITDGVRAIMAALDARLGDRHSYFLVDGERQSWDDWDWLHMGIWNRRPISGSLTWSQHAWGNAIDIGPLDGIDAQRPVYEVLSAIKEGRSVVAALTEYEKAAIARLESERIFTKYTTDEPGEVDEPVRVRTLAVLLDRLLDVIPRMSPDPSIDRATVVRWIVEELES